MRISTDQPGWSEAAGLIVAAGAMTVLEDHSRSERDDLAAIAASLSPETACFRRACN
ncbi:MAG: hypothetical protein GXY83_23245 [Rhodopirellula sp.]|nr:hypothetical protein [Rhodopirellula sp.]